MGLGIGQCYEKPLRVYSSRGL